VAALDAHEHGDLARLPGPADVGHRCRQRQIAGVLVDHAVGEVDEVQRPPGGGAAVGVGRRDVDREERRAQVALAHARDVDVVGGAALLHVLPLLRQLIRGVDVGIDDDGGLVQAPRPRRQILGGGRDGEEQAGDGKKQGAAHAHGAS
jgi:hypothetical protein